MIDKIKENWEKIPLIFKEEHEVSDVSYRTWLQPLTPYAFKGTYYHHRSGTDILAYVKRNTAFAASYYFKFLDQDCDVDFKVKKTRIEEEKRRRFPDPGK